MAKIYIVCILFILSGCYGINEKTSEIGELNTDCLEVNAWKELQEKYSIKTIVDTSFIDGLESISNRPFKTDVLYFNKSPKELVAISKDHYTVRYVYNPTISNQVLDGMSSKLSENEKKRIRNRIQMLLINYQCIDGKDKSKELIK